MNNNLSERLQGSFRQRIKTQRGLQKQPTGQEYVDGWVLDYNIMKDHEAHKGGNPAEAAGVAQQVPWESWEDITRRGGEVTEPRIKESVSVPKKPGPKPSIEHVQSAVAEYLDKKKVTEAKAKRRANLAPLAAP